jgi:RNA polymerase sigma-70 factor, ECF subfamily
MAKSVGDDVLLARINAGDGAAMKLLYERHSDALHRFIRARLRDPFEAADVMQDVFLEIWRAAGRFEHRSAPRTWLFGIARRKAADRARREPWLVQAEVDAEMPDEAPGPEALAEAATDAARLRACIERLSDSHRSAISRAFFEGMIYLDIAALEGVPVSTIKTRILHAKRLLQHYLTQYPGRHAAGRLPSLTPVAQVRSRGNSATRGDALSVPAPERPS